MGTSGTTARTSTTTSMPGRPFRWRNSSRMRRFARFRRTAPPTRRVAMMPSRATSIPFGRVNSVRYRPRLRTPCCWTRWNSGRRRIRSRRVRLRRTCRVVGRSPDGDPLAPLGTPALQHPLPGLRAHPLAEAVRSAATAPVRLIRTLHDPTTPTAALARHHASTARTKRFIVSEPRNGCQSEREAPSIPRSSVLAASGLLSSSSIVIKADPDIGSSQDCLAGSDVLQSPVCGSCSGTRGTFPHLWKLFVEIRVPLWRRGSSHLN